MIISDTHKFVFVAIPKTGSKSMAAFLLDKFEAYRHGFHHQWKVPELKQDYYIYSVVRNPYERCFSMWWFACKTDNRSGSVFKKGTPFDTYMNWVIQRKSFDPNPRRNVPELFMSQSMWFDKSGARQFLKLEDIPASLDALPFYKSATEFPHKNRLDEKSDLTFWDYFGQREAALVHQYCEEDFERFGYVKR